MSKLFFFSLYFTSFTPLWLSVLFIDIKSYIENSQSTVVEFYSIIVILIIWLISILIIKMVLFSKYEEGTTRFILNSVKEEKSIASEYLLSYILPLFAFDFTKWDSVILFLIFFVTLAFLCIRHNYFSVNIVLEVLKYQVYSCEIENDDQISLTTSIISRKNLMAKKGEEIRLKALNNEYKLDV
ncbi:hypothetical protein [Streptococcus oralis]|uniref:Uncharacterized protein n=1 Tax=Streptococcus oralis subsp. tigurinus 2426 TaxID=1333865 RepID=S9SXS4_STROR|nr:hypothetical protein [Streptococcus oralis]EMG35186.1 hypothetical protein H353_01535 [Streptococcus oralis subsp. tigurinus 1366]EPX90131.1 hypothetical protein L697_02200 [Streptococcus oralis subsp. tigurinus 2425]EPX91164.1 hypothetical protein L698_01460 [Streptococcus oralis subsp. tigurinus 2426]